MSTFASRTDLLPYPSVLATITATQIKAFRRLVKLGDSPAKPRAFRCIPATADALVVAGLAVECNGLYRSALAVEVEEEASVWFDLFHDRAYEPTSIMTAARPDGRLHYLRVRVRSCGGATAEVLPVRGFPMVNSIPMDAKRVEAEGWLLVDARDEDREAIRAAGFGSMVPEPAVELGTLRIVKGAYWADPSTLTNVEGASSADPNTVHNLDGNPPALQNEPNGVSPWDAPYRLVAVRDLPQRDWWFSSRQQRVAAALGVPDFEPAPVVPAPPADRVIGILGRSYALQSTAIDPEVGPHAFAARVERKDVAL